MSSYMKRREISDGMSALHLYAFNSDDGCDNV